MSIAAAFVCDEGIVMCADSQESYGDLKWPVQKLVTDNLFGFCPMMISGAGFGAAIDSATEQIVAKLQGGFDHKTALEHIRDILRDIHQNDLPYFPSDTQAEKQFELLIALKTSDTSRPFLYKTTGSLLQHVKEYAVIGSGTLVNYSARTLFSRYDMPMSLGVILATHLIRLAKSQLTSVGGNSFIATLSSAGKIEYANPWELPDTEDVCAEFMGRSGRLMLQCADPGFNETEFAKELVKFVNETTRLKKKQIDNRKRWEDVWSVLSGKGSAATPSDDQKSEDQQ